MGHYQIAKLVMIRLSVCWSLSRSLVLRSLEGCGTQSIDLRQKSITYVPFLAEELETASREVPILCCANIRIKMQPAISPDLLQSVGL